MGLFSKKPDKEKKVETEESKKGEVFVEAPTKINIDKEYPYIVQLNDIEDNTIIRRAPFGAKRYIDGANVWLVNEKVGFKEPFPTNTQEFKNYTLSEIDKKLESLKKKLENIRTKEKNKRVTSDELDVLEDIKKFNNYKRSHLFMGNGSYLQISAEHGGRPLYTFDRAGNFKLPVFKNTDKSLLYVPTETDIATAGELLKLNDDENGIKDNTFKLITLGMVVILALAICFMGWIGYKQTQMPEDLALGLTELTKTNIELTKEIGVSIDKMNNVTDKLKINTADVKVNPDKVVVNN